MKPTFLKSIFLFFLITIFSILLIKAQDPIWKWASTGSYGTITQVETDSVGNTYVYGKTSEQSITFGNNTITYDNISSYDNAFIVKYNSTGKVLWARGVYGSGDYPYISPVKMAVSEKGEVAILFNYQYLEELVLSNTYSIPIVNDSSFYFGIVKYSKTGVILWARTVIGEGPSVNVNGSDIVIDSEGSVVTTGNFRADNINFDPEILAGQTNSPLFYVAKYDPVGELVFAYTCGLDPNDDNASFYGRLVTLDNDNNIIFTGEYNGSRTFYFGADSLIEAGSNDLALVKLSPEGNLIWAKSFGKSNSESPDQVYTDNEGNVYFCGYFQMGTLDFDGYTVTNNEGNYDLFITKLSPSGMVEWATYVEVQKSFVATPGTNIYFHIDKDNFLYVAANFTSSTVFTDGNTLVNPDPGSNDILIAKLEPANGEVIWTRSGTGDGNNNMGNISFDKYGNTYLIGNLLVPTYFDGVELIDPTATNGGFYIVRYNAEGNLHFAGSRVNPDLTNRLSGSRISVDAFQNIYFFGSSQGENNTLGNLDMDELSASSGLFLAKYSYVADINGLVSDLEGTPITTGYVKLIGYTMFQRSPLSDSVQIINDGTYHFSDIPFGKYIIYAKPSDDYPNLVPTYYTSAGYWTDARTLYINTPVARNGVNIFMNEREERIGDAVLAGTVNELEEDELKSTNHTNAKPIAGSEVVLIRSTPKNDYEVIAVTYTDEEGNFSFENVEDGDYILLVDIPGIPHETYYSITIEGGEYYSNLDYFIGEETIEISGEFTVIKNSEVDDLPDLLTYPNPCKDEIFIVLTENNISPVHAEIFDINGKSVFSTVIPDPSAVQKINVNELQTGLYMLKITYMNKTLTGKIIKE